MGRSAKEALGYEVTYKLHYEDDYADIYPVLDDTGYQYDEARQLAENYIRERRAGREQKYEKGL